jgi:hypothetical protein
MKRTVEIEIPDGYELDSGGQNNPNIYDGKPVIFMWLKKVEEKNFNWYVEQYNLIDKYFLDILTGRFAGIPFEIKIGLLKFICDEIQIDLLDYITSYISGERMPDQRIKNICPKEFLESIFK